MKKGAKIALWIVGSIATVLMLFAAVGWWLFGGFLEDFEFADVDISWRSQLPDSATEVQEWSWADGFLPDYSYVLKAKVSEGEFMEFNRKLGLLLNTPDRSYSGDKIWLSWEAPPLVEGDWWNPSDDLGATYVRQGSDTWTYAKFENGYLFFKSVNH